MVSAAAFARRMIIGVSVSTAGRLIRVEPKWASGV
jgi:hypothetical protein